ncbi:MAG TPA: L,D-transpeptidase family protein [Solirubrobacterales bacterium]|nr:L,D-transpeptidase family protein [Solirubrobacterales bacterium]
MLIEDRSTEQDLPPDAPRRWPKRLLVGGVMVVLVGAIAAFVAAAFALSGASIEEDGSSLGKVSTDAFGGSVESVKATAVKSGADVPVKMEGDRIVPTAKLHPGEEVAVEVKVKRPSVIGTLAGGEKTLNGTVTAPVAKLAARWLSVKEGKNPRLHFNRPISEIVYGQEGEMKHRRFDRPRSSVALGKQPPAGQMRVSWAALSWEHPGKAKTVTWFPATGTPTVAATPTAGTTISASTPVEITFSEPVRKILGAEEPKLSPEVEGKWSQPSPHTLRFQPAGFGAPLATHLKVELPEEVEVVQADGTTKNASEISWEVPAGSELRLQQLLAGLGYLPYKWNGEEVAKTPEAQVAAATTETPKGHFSPRWHHTPQGLKELWTPGKANVLVEGALMSFEERNGLEVDGVAGPVVWEALMKATIAGEKKPTKGASNGFTWVSVSEALPETVTVWHNGKTVLSGLSANTGIPGAETELGTHNVYLRFEETTMSGENPDGSHYEDPGIKWVSYFYGGDALHAFDRASYGSPQSLGCVEMPLEDAESVYPYTPIGTPVTVNPA